MTGFPGTSLRPRTTIGNIPTFLTANPVIVAPPKCGRKHGNRLQAAYVRTPDALAVVSSSSSHLHARTCQPEWIRRRGRPD